MDLPTRLTLGKYYIGPDHYGCFNTGLAPAILKSRLLYKWCKSQHLFAVGPQLFIDDAISDLLHHRPRHFRGTKATWIREKRYKVRFFRTSKAAKRYFLTLVMTAIEKNKQERSTHKALIEKAKAGDMSAVSELINY